MIIVEALLILNGSGRVCVFLYYFLILYFSTVVVGVGPA